MEAQNTATSITQILNEMDSKVFMNTAMYDSDAFGILPRKRRPEHQECLLGFILRLTELMGWEKITWMLDYAGIGKSKWHLTPFSFVFNSSLDLTVLGHVTCNDPKMLYPMLYLPSGNTTDSILFMGQKVPKYFITTTTPRVCPLCLKEKNYIRALWDFGLITCCPIHNCLLVEKCPNCGKKLTWYRNKVSGCIDDTGCGYDFRDMPVEIIDSEQTYLAKHIYSLLKVPKQRSTLSKKNPVSRLDLLNFSKLVVFLSKTYSPNVSVRDIRQFMSINLIDRHHAIQAIRPILCKWPDGFYRHLDSIRPDNNSTFGLTDALGKKNYEHLATFGAGGFDIVKDALKSYLYDREIRFIRSKMA
jgi:hypothetical protein